MQDLLGKISSYNLFNYLFSGVLFVILSSALTNHSFFQEDLIIGAFLYYFIGLVVSRIGSLIIEPILKILSFIKFESYSNFVIALKKDPGLDVLSEVNNMYRSLVSVCVSVILLIIYDAFGTRFAWLHSLQTYFLLLFLLTLFLFAYRKQTGYITKRIKANLQNHE